MALWRSGRWEYMQIKMYGRFREIMVLKLVIKLLLWVVGKEEKMRSHCS